jgi:hypothetical protein
MFPFGSDYVWRDGVPQLVDRVDLAQTKCSFRLVHDPYHKRFTLERYIDGEFDSVGYDSALLDFRSLSEANQMAWGREVKPDHAIIRDEHDRVVLVERYGFENDRARTTKLISPQGTLIGTQHIYYEDLGDSFSGVVLFDPWDHAVLLKKYALSDDGEFSTLLCEQWNMEAFSYGKGFSV